MDSKQATFAERIIALKDAANTLRAIAELVLSEAQRMDAAQERFAARTASRAKK